MSKSLFITLLISSYLFFCTSAVPSIANQIFPEICASLDYPVETHNITTADGYINTYFRIQAKNTQIQSGLPVIYLQHGLVDSSDNWVINNETIAPGFIIANRGYDVWLGNTRGNRYSLSHVAWNSSDSNSLYWDFAWQNMSVYDLPAAFEYISSYTGQMINYIGHSQGTAIMFEALARRDPVILASLERYFALGPIGWVNHASSPVLKVLGDLKIGEITFRLDGKKILFTDNSTREFLELDCELLDFTCIESLKELADFHPDVDNTKRMDVFVGHYPAGTSDMNMAYWNQMQLNNGDSILMFDYGQAGNLLHYNSTTPPAIDIGNINVPVHLFSGLYDELADPTDVQRLYNALTGSPNVTWHQYPYGHATYMWGLNLTYLTDLFAILEDVSDHSNEAILS